MLSYAQCVTVWMDFNPTGRTSATTPIQANKLAEGSKEASEEELEKNKNAK